MSKTKNYSLCLKQAEAILDSSLPNISLYSNLSALLFETLEHVNWVGFYLYIDDALYLGPFQGKVACTKIELNKGVCGTSAYERKTILVDNVHKFAGHIACDGASNSEIVVPIIKEDALIGVLDVDSYNLNQFDLEDQTFLESIVKILITALK